MWKIHGVVYDLNEFKQHHPGGETVLDACKGSDDLTATFESNHALSDMDKIKSIMKKYQVSTCEQSKYSFEPNGFYNTLKQRVRNYFQLNTKNHQTYKTNTWWYVKTLVQSAVFLGSTYLAFGSTDKVSHLNKSISGFVAGHMWIQLGFTTMHDASHFALFKNAKYNETVAAIWNSISVWDNWMWTKHHVFRHHAFTGDVGLDPDIIHFRPFIQKTSQDHPEKYFQVMKRYPHASSIMFVSIFPGMFVGQALQYNIIWNLRKHLWKIKLMDKPFNLLETLLKLPIPLVAINSIINGNIIPFLAFIMSCNITYSVFILPDHDSHATEQNKLTNTDGIDWGETQVRHSGNFSTKNPYVYNAFGGINYQIEHHLFPTICHVHYPAIQPIVKQTCKEFDIPYVDNPSIYHAVASTLHNYNVVAISTTL